MIAFKDDVLSTPALTELCVVDIIDGEVHVHSWSPSMDTLSLENLQRTVGGYIEVAWRTRSRHRPDVAIVVYVNEEGLVMGMPMTFCIVDQEYGLLGPFAGDAVVVGLLDGDTVALTAEEAAEIKVVTQGLALAYGHMGLVSVIALTAFNQPLGEPKA